MGVFGGESRDGWGGFYFLSVCSRFFVRMFRNSVFERGCLLRKVIL